MKKLERKELKNLFGGRLPKPKGCAPSGTNCQFAFTFGIGDIHPPGTYILQGTCSSFQGSCMCKAEGVTSIDPLTGCVIAD
jgi:hypothetical protein